MSPRKLAEWVVVLVGALFAIVVLGEVSREVISQKTPLLDHLFGTKSSTIAISALVLLAASISFALVLLLRATTGPLEFKALGIEFRGPSGPLLLWAVCFIAVCASAVGLLKASSNPQSPVGVASPTERSVPSTFTAPTASPEPALNAVCNRARVEFLFPLPDAAGRNPEVSQQLSVVGVIPGAATCVIREISMQFDCGWPDSGPNWVNRGVFAYAHRGADVAVEGKLNLVALTDGRGAVVPAGARCQVGALVRYDNGLTVPNWTAFIYRP